MRDVKRLKAGRRSLCSAAVALILMAVLIILPSVSGFASVDEALQGPFTLTVNPGNNDSEEQIADLRTANVTIDLYKIADVQKVSGYDTFEFVLKKDANGEEDRTYGSLFSEDLASISNKEITSEEWEAIAQKAAALVLDPDQGIAIQSPDQSGGDIETPIDVKAAGLYLVVPRGTDTTYVEKSEDGDIVTIATSDTYKYSFLPQLISFPSKDADENGVINTANTGDWLKDVTINLKFSYEERLGALDIIKGLEVYETKDPATFVFQVTGRTPAGAVIFSNSYSMVFDLDTPREQKVSINDLPAGTIVTVKEAYSGSSFERIVPSDSDTIIADPIKAKDVVKVEFNNTYDGTYKGGGSAENVFTKGEDGWNWYKVVDGKKVEINNEQNEQD